jgi:hypothetical protein
MAAQIAKGLGMQALQTVKQKKMFSKYARRIPKIGNFLGDILGDLGFRRALSYGPMTQKQSARKNAKKANRKATRKNNRGRPRGPPAIVGANAAPVAFGRDAGWKPIRRVTREVGENGIEVHTVDFWTTVAPSTTAGTLAITSQACYPTNTSLFPYSSADCLGFLKFRLKKLKCHYQHFAPTSTQCQVGMNFFPDPAYNGSTGVGGLNISQLQDAGNMLTGACYEDFSKEFDLSNIGQGGTKDLFDNGANLSGDDNRLNIPGTLAFWTANNTVTTGTLGNIWVEAVWEFVERKLSTVTVALHDAYQIITARKIQREAKEKLLYKIMTKLLDDQDKANRPAPIRDFVQEMSAKYTSPPLAVGLSTSVTPAGGM